MPPEAVPLDPTTPIAADVETVAVGSPVTCSWALPPETVTYPQDWLTLIPVGMAIGPSGYGDWKYTGGALSGSLQWTAPPTPGWYEFRYYPNNGLQLAWTSPPFLVTTTPAAPVFSPGDTPQERQANADALQSLIDAGCLTGRAILPDGDLRLDLSPERPYIRVWNRLTLTSAGKTTIHVGPDTEPYTPGEWALWRVEPGSFKFELMPGIDAFGPRCTPYIESNGVVYNPGAGYQIRFLHSKGAHLAGSQREIVVRQARTYCEVTAQPKGFVEGAYIEEDAPGSFTRFRLDDSHIEAISQAVVAFGAGGETWLRGNELIAGWIHGEGLNGQGNVIYCHQGRPLYATGNLVVTRFGRDCLKYAGIRAEGRGVSSKIDGNVFRCDRVNALKAIGIQTATADEHWGTGIGMDKFAECSISNNYFEASLAGAVQYWGKVTLTGGVVECPWVFGAGGDQTGEHPMITCIGVRMAGISYVMSSVLENAVWSFVACPIETDKAVTLFATSQRPQRVYIRDCPIRIWNGDGEPFGEQLGTWEVTNSPVLRD